jgi:hypothetical protein
VMPTHRAVRQPGHIGKPPWRRRAVRTAIPRQGMPLCARSNDRERSGDSDV